MLLSVDIRFHFLPLSSERYKPPFDFSASTMAYTLFGLARETDTPILPTSLGSPSIILFHVSPASLDFQIALPGPPLSTFHGYLLCCQVAAYKIRGLVM